MNLINQFGRFLVVGCVGLLVLLGATYLFAEILNLWYFWAYILGTLLSWTSIFFLNSVITFTGHDKKRYGRKYVTFIGMYVGAFAVNATIVYILTSGMGVHYLVSITIATAVTTLITFTLSKTLIFTYGNQD